MILTTLSLKDFRSHSNTSINLSKGLNYIVGGNGQGKTSILESIYYLCTTKGYNSKNDSEVVRFDQDYFEIKGSFSDLTSDDVMLRYSMVDNKKNYLLNNKIVSRNADVIGRYPVVNLTPADHSITQGYPSERRKLIDSILSQASGNYLFTLLDFNKALRQRSSLLSKLKEGWSRNLLLELDAWTEKLILSGTDIINYRRKFLTDFNNYVKESYTRLLNDDEIPLIKYSTLDDYKGEDIKGRYEELCSEKKNEELRRGANLVGPHRDDLVFEINNLNLKTYGSQGQNKTFQVVIRFAEFFFLKDVTGKTPIFLLDDVFGELDANRSFKISEYLKSVGQAFITLTDFANMSFLSREENDLVLRLENGQVKYA